MENKYLYKGKLFETDPDVDKANAEFDKAKIKYINKEITYDEMIEVKNKVNEAVNKSTIGWTIRKEIRDGKS